MPDEAPCNTRDDEGQAAYKPVLPGRTQREVILNAAERIDLYADARQGAPEAAFYRASARLLRSHGQADCTGDRYGACDPSGPLSCPEHYEAFLTACAYLGFGSSEPLRGRP